MRKRGSLRIGAAALTAFVLSGAALAGGTCDGRMITALPDTQDGVLTYAGRVIRTGEGVPAENLDSLAYLPAGSQSGTYSYIPVYKDGSVGEEMECIIGTQGNSAPQAQDMELSTYRNLSVSGILPVWDDGGEYECRLLTKPELGMTEIEGNSFVYTPYQNKTGTDSFSYIVRDANGEWSGEAVVTIDIDRQRSDVVYSDMSSSPAAYAAVRLAEEGVYAGRVIGGARYFEPDEPVSRAEFIAMTMAAAGREPVLAASTGFEDDEAIPAWTRAYVTAAVQEGVIMGEGGEDAGAYLRGEDSITLQEAAVILYNTLSPEKNAGAVMAASLPDWAAEQVCALQGCGILAVSGLEPSRELTREDAAGLLLGLMTCREEEAVKTGLFSWTAAS